jgi:1-phosphofructokinase
METEEQILAGGKALPEMGVTRALISLGGNGAYFMEKGAAYRAKCPRVEVKSTVGAGDSVVAAMAYGLQENLPLEEALLLAMAMGAASVMQTGTQAPDRALVSDLTRQAEVTKV